MMLLTARLEAIPLLYAIPAALALLMEICLYLNVRRVSTWSNRAVLASAVVPFLLLTVGGGGFRPESLALLLGLTCVAVFWFVVLPYTAMTEIAFLAFMAGVYLLKLHRTIFPDPWDVDIHAMGQLMWFRLGLATMLKHRGNDGIGFGFLPTRADVLVGVRWFAYLLPLLVFASLIGAFPYQMQAGWPWKAVGTLAGIYLVVAAAEEFFFRGILQQRVGIPIASAVFGLVHVFFGTFPNWKMMIAAMIAGVFYGKAFAEGRSVRASMVTHALTVAVWRTFLS